MICCKMHGDVGQTNTWDWHKTPTNHSWPQHQTMSWTVMAASWDIIFNDVTTNSTSSSASRVKTTWVWSHYYHHWSLWSHSTRTPPDKEVTWICFWFYRGNCLMTLILDLVLFSTLLLWLVTSQRISWYPWNSLQNAYWDLWVEGFGTMMLCKGYLLKIILLSPKS